MTKAANDQAKTWGSRHPGAKGLDCTYNLFRRAEHESLVCAVPLDHPVPRFLSGPSWLFARALHPFTGLPPGFAVRAASEAVRFNGFYLFHLTAGLMPDESGPRPAPDIEIRTHVRTILKQLGRT